MTRSRRQAHRVAFIAVGCVLAMVWTAGLTLRPEVPPVDASLEDLTYQTGFVVDGTDFSMPVADASFATSFRSDPDGAYLLIRPLTPILKPDLLAYWVPSSEKSQAGELREDAVLTGSLAGNSPRRLLLPPGAAQGEGEIIIYSLVHENVVTRFPVRSATSTAGDSR